MRRPDRSIERVYLHRAPVDMRKQMDGLAIHAKEALRLEFFCRVPPTQQAEGASVREERLHRLVQAAGAL